MMSELETLPSDFEDVTSEVHDDGYVDGNGEFQEFESSGADPAVAAEDEVTESEEVSSEEVEVSTEEVLLDDISVDEVIPLDVAPFSLVTLPDSGNTWRVSIDGTEYYAYFPDSAELENLDGELVNMGASAVTALLSVDGTANTAAYNSYYLTINPLLSTSSNNNAYRYGSRSTLTYYYPGSGTSLSSTVSYVSVAVVDEPKLGWSLSLDSLIIFALLLFLCLCELIGGILRR